MHSRPHDALSKSDKQLARLSDKPGPRLLLAKNVEHNCPPYDWKTLPNSPFELPSLWGSVIWRERTCLHLRQLFGFKEKQIEGENVQEHVVIWVKNTTYKVSYISRQCD